jgi:hypothetical protein
MGNNRLVFLLEKIYTWMFLKYAYVQVGG